MQKTGRAVINSAILLAALLLAVGTTAQAHQVKSLTAGNGSKLTIVEHQHVFGTAGYGGTYRTGHAARVGDNGITIWSAKQYNGYASSQTRNKHYRGGFGKAKSSYGRSTSRQYGRNDSRDK